MISKLKCFFGFHETSSYSEELNFDGEKMVEASNNLFGSISADSFLELSALRCKKCNYSYKAKTKNNFDAIGDLCKK